jgi:hypothetical protein
MIDPTLCLWILALLAFVGFCYVVGRLALDALIEPTPPILIAGTTVVGTFVIALQLWLFGVVHLPWNPLTLVLPWVAIAALRRERFMHLVHEDRQRLIRLTQVLSTLNGLELILTVAGTVVVLAYLLSLVAQPVFAWDAIETWVYKAKVYYEHQAVGLQPIMGERDRHLDYPPLYSLIVASLYTFLGKANDILGKAVTFIFLLSGAAASLVALSRWLNRQLAIAFTFVLLALPLFGSSLLTGAYMGLADYPLAICMMFSLLCFYDGETSGQHGLYLFAVVFAAMAALMKNEGLVFLFIVMSLLVLHLVLSGKIRRPARRDWPVLAVLLLAIVPVLAWQVYVQTAGIANTSVGRADPALWPSRAATIFKFFMTLPTLTGTGTPAGIVPASYGDVPWLAVSFLLSGVLLAANRFRAGTLIWIAIGLQAISYFVVYLCTPLEIGFHLTTSGDRLVMELAPPILLSLAIALRPHLTGRLAVESVGVHHPNARISTSSQPATA